MLFFTIEISVVVCDLYLTEVWNKENRRIIYGCVTILCKS